VIVEEEEENPSFELVKKEGVEGGGEKKV